MATTTTPRPDAVIEWDGVDWVVWAEWVGVDRPRSLGIRTSDHATARRLADAIEGGLVFPKAEILVDNYGKTYMSAPPTVMGRTLATDLRRLEAKLPHHESLGGNPVN